jgi:hypothetical protein
LLADLRRLAKPDPLIENQAAHHARPIAEFEAEMLATRRTA